MLNEMYKNRIEKQTGLKMQWLKENDFYQEGKTYWCGYWQELYKVLEIFTKDRSWYVKVQWVKDNHISTHFTNLDIKWDFMVVE